MIKKKSNAKESITFQDIVSSLKTTEEKDASLEKMTDEEYARVAKA